MSRLYITNPVIKPNRMKLFVVSAIVMFCLATLPGWAQPTGATRYNPLDAGYFSSSVSKTFMDYKNNSTYNGFGNDYGQPSDDIYYQFIITSAVTINVSLCGSSFDTYLHILDGVNGETVTI